ncbi:L,D-transpeptidase family protein [Aestuariimicrobium ganziense]|uniref:L,D-transpeptidase family protein n=1 Tax=Aestuariimicrobium ganziense TaxID=2773677 RepID=UPI001F1E7E2A|nr:peptidoglycan-binding protein [Aestuariimicrobium ganziense]
MNPFAKRVGALIGLTLALSVTAGCAKDLTAGRSTAGEQPTQVASAPSTTGATSAVPSTARPSLPTGTVSASPSATTQTPTPTPTPTVKPLLAPGDSGEQVRELQHRLLQLQWYDGKITENYGPATTEAVTGFQRKRNFEPTGKVDQRTWDTLVKMTKKPTHDQMHNILRPGPALYKAGATGDPVRRIQVRLKQLDWFSPKIDGVYGATTVEAVKGFQAKREIPVTGEIDQRTLDLLVGMTRTPTAEEMYNKPPKVNLGRIDERCMTGRVLCISKDSRRMMWMIDGKVIESYSVRFGSVRTPTREGVFSVYWKSRDHHSTQYDSPMPFAMFFDGGQAVHYSSDFAARGYAGASHGCVNVRDYNGIKWLFDTQVKVGDKVVVYR